MQPRIKKSTQNIIFKKLACALLLFTFLLSITPKQLLHFIAADHTDLFDKKTNDRFQFNQYGFKCHCNEIVATSPFTETVNAPHDFQCSYNSSPDGIFRLFLSSTTHFYFDLRGPPVIV